MYKNTENVDISQNIFQHSNDNKHNNIPDENSEFASKRKTTNR